MRKREMERLLARHVAPAYPELQLRGDLLARIDGPLLRGVLFDRLTGPAFRVTPFVQVLSMPEGTLSLGLSLIVGDYALDEEADEDELFAHVLADLHAKGDPWLAERATLEAVAERAAGAPGWMIDGTLVRRLRAHCLVHMGRHRDARRELARLRRRLWLDPGPAGLRDQADELRRALADSPAAADALLDRWTAQTRTALGL